MKLIYIPLALLFFTAIYCQGFALSGSNSLSYDEFSGTLNDTGDESTLTVEGYDVDVGFDAQDGILVFVVSMVAITCVAGITVMGSGLKEISVKVLYITVSLFGVWGLVSLFAVGGLTAIPIFGSFFYFILTLVYGLGVFQLVSGVSG